LAHYTPGQLSGHNTLDRHLTAEDKNEDPPVPALWRRKNMTPVYIFQEGAVLSLGNEENSLENIS